MTNSKRTDTKTVKNHAGNAMRQLQKELSESSSIEGTGVFGGFGIDFENDGEPWTKSYANLRLNIIEPDLDIDRNYIDEPQLRYDLCKWFEDRLRWARSLWGDSKKLDSRKPKPGEWIVWLRQYPWLVTVELYRQSLKK